ncbi:hypothetical protein HC891_23300 [Candidatus Gracilibacteria bacterium]|nr:hypothetical protein [Candidatus Gracilibacteria bacterium]
MALRRGHRLDAGAGGHGLRLDADALLEPGPALPRRLRRHRPSPWLPVYTTPLVAARWVLLHGLATAIIALAMALDSTLGWAYLLPTALTTLWMLWSGLRFLRTPERKQALDFFKVSNLYLAIVLLLACGAAVL